MGNRAKLGCTRQMVGGRRANGRYGMRLGIESVQRTEKGYRANKGTWAAAMVGMQIEGT